MFVAAAYIYQLPCILISGFELEGLSPSFAAGLLLIVTMPSIEAIGRKLGWYFKMGGVARRVRRSCLEVDVEGGEETMKERLVWWVEGLLRNDMDGEEGGRSEKGMLSFL
jgi:hypothetical protein